MTQVEKDLISELNDLKKIVSAKPAETKVVVSSENIGASKDVVEEKA